MDAQELLQSVPLFHGLDKQHVESLAKFCHERSFAGGDVIVREGESGIGLFIIGSGQVEVTQQRGGRDERLRYMGAGEVFGEIGLLADHPRTATVRATGPTTCLVLTSLSFHDALDGSPEIAGPLLKTVAGWLVEAEDRASAHL